MNNFISFLTDVIGFENCKSFKVVFVIGFENCKSFKCSDERFVFTIQRAVS